MTSCVVKLSVYCISFLLLGDEREGERERTHCGILLQSALRKDA
jgi:hypothetical protein